MFYFLLGLGFVFSLSYVYRKRLVNILFRIMLRILTYSISLYSYYNRKENTIKRIKYSQLGDSYVLDEYNIIHNDKVHHVSLIANSNNILYQDLVHLKKETYNKLQNKNIIVHCSITNNNKDVIIDITDIFRRFSFYFDKKDTDVKLDALLMYIKDKCNMVDEDNHNLMIYMNDECFSEYIYSLKDIKNHTFYNILFNKET